MTYSLFVKLTLRVRFFEIKVQYFSRVELIQLLVGFFEPLCGMPDAKVNLSTNLRHWEKSKMRIYIYPIFVNQYVHSLN